MYRFLTYCDTEKDVNDFWKEYIGNIKPFYLEQKKDDDVIISASPEFAETRLQKAQNKKPYGVKGRYAQRKIFGCKLSRQGKGKTILWGFSWRKIDNFYSDSYSDSPLAEIAEKAFMVDGDKVEGWIFFK